MGMRGEERIQDVAPLRRGLAVLEGHGGEGWNKEVGMAEGNGMVRLGGCYHAGYNCEYGGLKHERDRTHEPGGKCAKAAVQVPRLNEAQLPA
jgi:hypothetical protein